MTCGRNTPKRLRLVTARVIAGLVGGLVGWALWLPMATPPIEAQEIEIYYGPEDRPGDRLVRLYENAKRSIFIAAYGITYRQGVKALVRAKQRGVDVRIITDAERLKDRHQRRALESLRRAGIPIKVDRHDGLMHLKQVVVDDAINTSGSMNLTNSGNRYNDDRLNVITDPVTTAKARAKFLAMWKDTTRYKPW